MSSELAWRLTSRPEYQTVDMAATPIRVVAYTSNDMPINFRQVLQICWTVEPNEGVDVCHILQLPITGPQYPLSPERDLRDRDLCQKAFQPKGTGRKSTERVATFVLRSRLQDLTYSVVLPELGLGGVC